MDELVKRLRECTAEQNGEKTLWHQAADAIEAFETKAEVFKAAYIAEHNERIDEIKRHMWIPVTARLPDDRGNYLVVINCPRGRWDEICAFDGEGEWVSIDEYAEVATKWVTHWMQLPEPPKAEEDET